MKLLILDTETTGLEVKEGAKVIEIGAVLYSVTHKTILQQLSTLKPVVDNPAFDINRIPLAASHAMVCEETGGRKPFDCAMSLLCAMAEEADYIVAHNAPFDKMFMDDITATEEPLFEFMDKKWICTKSDFTWPVRKGCMLNLVHIAVDLGVPVISAHRALTDCLLIASCFDRVEDLEQRINDALKERFTYRAILTYDERQKAKDKGFEWNAASKVWTKRLTEEEASKLDFSVSKVTGSTNGIVNHLKE